MQQHYGVSQRRTSMTLRFNRASLQYRPRRSPVNDALRERIKELASTRVRYGYRHIHVLLQREGWKVNPKRVARLYRQEGLSLRAKAPKRRRRSAAQRVRLAPSGPNQVWGMDFMHDRLRGDQSRKFRLLTNRRYLHARMPGTRSRSWFSSGAGGSGALTVSYGARRTDSDSLRPRNGVHCGSTRSMGVQ
jgi:transposase InsO family protein